MLKPVPVLFTGLLILWNVDWLNYFLNKVCSFKFGNVADLMYLRRNLGVFLFN